MMIITKVFRRTIDSMLVVFAFSALNEELLRKIWNIPEHKYEKFSKLAIDGISTEVNYYRCIKCGMIKREIVAA